MLDGSTKKGLARATQVAEDIIDARWADLGETVNGWRYNTAGGRAGRDFALRAALAKYQLGDQLAVEVLYPPTSVDADGRPLEGSNRYTLRFPAGEQPPVSQFWNLGLYDSDMLFIENDLGRYTIGSTTDGLTSDPDGSLTLYLQHDRPDNESAVANWLPAPNGPFNLVMRFYGPSTFILDGTYRLPPITIDS